ncbi:hypothetical protein DSO57_1023316 [Entomophthora muscae]|uniref:Uncharacterized protein n=1 Tax=Entomophthora muscae TaxID=34485 RepID=A0ACC2SSF4_9FUNG|nr:hypothetical protein DSO57_1023316 [Entomophthora muscae]
MLHWAMCISLSSPQILIMNPGPWKTCSGTPAQIPPKDPYQIVCDSKSVFIYPLIFNRKYNNPAVYLLPMEPPLTPKPTISTPPTFDATGQNSQFLGVLYLVLTGWIDSALPVAGPWAVAGKALSYLIKLGPIIWWAMPVPALTPSSPTGVPWYSWYPDILPYSFLSATQTTTHGIFY